jgi:hypothetical protein
LFSSLAELWGGYNKYLFCLNDLAAVGDSAGMGIIGGAHGGRHGTDFGDYNLVGLAGGGIDLGGSGCSGECKNDNESANDVFHVIGLIPFLFSLVDG